MAVGCLPPRTPSTAHRRSTRSARPRGLGGLEPCARCAGKSMAEIGNRKERLRDYASFPKISIYRAQRSQQGCSLSLGMLRLAEPPTGRARLRSSLKSPRNPITPFETSRVATLHPGLYTRFREGARRVIGATAKPLYAIDGKAEGLDRRPHTSGGMGSQQKGGGCKTRRLSLYSAVCVSVAPTMACVHVWFSVTR